jgi:hypothetical protein
VADLKTLTSFADKAAEEAVLKSISVDQPWELVEGIVEHVRLSGTEEERKAFDLIIDKLKSWGVSYTLHEPECFISHPLAATIRFAGEGGKSFRAKTSAMSVNTDGQEIEGELVYIPVNSKGFKPGDVFAAGVTIDEMVKGKIVITEGFAAPGKVIDVMRAGALAGVFINPGKNIHEGICTTIWGTPDLDNQGDQPSIPVVAVNKESGLELIEHAKKGGRVALSTTLDTRWRTIPVLVADVKGALEPEKYVLLHGHVDGWHYGAGDNATGDATMAEIARAFNENKGQLKRSLKVAWWSGHSHGRYAGSTWFADHFAIDLANNCLAQVNCDSPGCRWAETYNELTSFTEANSFVINTITDVTGIVPEPERPVRAGDYSFNGIGLTGFYMLSSTMTEEAKAEKGYYAVGGCGANIEWHTEEDLMHILDKEILLRDIKMYAASVLRVVNAPVAPFDFLATAAEFKETLDGYQAAAEGVFDFAPSYAALANLESALTAFYAAIPAGATVENAKTFNDAQLRLARILIPVNYSRMEAFKHDPALSVKPLPDLAPATLAPSVKDDVAQRGVLRASLTRGQNRLVWALQMAAEAVAV